PTTCRHASPRRSSRELEPTSSWRSETGRSSTPKASPTPETSPRRSARPKAATTMSPSWSPRSATKWIGVPWGVVGLLVAYRKSWFDEIGYNTFPETWDALRDAGKKLKAKGRPLGQTAGHTFGDAPSWWYPYLWSWGGKEVEADGKTVVLNSRETVESVKFAVGFWKDTCDEGGLAWDDSSNNRAFLAGSISATNNGASIYIEAKRKPEAYQTENGTPMWKDILHARIPKGPGGQFNLPVPFTDM